jgi:hypothetical protein
MAEVLVVLSSTWCQVPLGEHLVVVVMVHVFCVVAVVAWSVVRVLLAVWASTVYDLVFHHLTVHRCQPVSMWDRVSVGRCLVVSSFGGGYDVAPEGEYEFPHGWHEVRVNSVVALDVGQPLAAIRFGIDQARISAFCRFWCSGVTCIAQCDCHSCIVEYMQTWPIR